MTGADTVNIARAALHEAGRPDLAELVKLSPLGRFAVARASRSAFDDESAAVMIRALYIAHASIHPSCRLEDDRERGEPTIINCPVCRAEAAS